MKIDKRDKKDILNAVKNSKKKDKRKPYQTIGSLKGERDTDLRCIKMKLPDSFKNKSVLDIGCNLGAMCQVSKERGSSKVVGIDNEDYILQAASNLFLKHGYDISLVNYDINKNGFESLLDILGKDKFDYIFALSIYHHIKNKKILWDIINYYCNDVCWFEGHNRNTDKEIYDALSSNLNAKK